MSRCTWLALGLVLGGCQSSYLARRGDLAAERGAQLQAIADYGHLLATNTSLEAAKIAPRHHAIVEAWVEARRLEIENQASDQAVTALLELVVTPWITQAAKGRLVEDLERRGEEVWPAIEATAARGHHVAANRAAHRLSDRAPALAPRTQRLAIAGARFHQAQAEAAKDPRVAAFHLRIANSLVPGTTAPPPPFTIERRGPLALHLAKGCEALGPMLEANLGGQTGPKLELSLDTCSANEERSRAIERYPAIVQVAQTTTATTWIEVDGVVSPKVTTIQTWVHQSVLKEREVVSRRLLVVVAGVLKVDGGAAMPLDSTQTHEDRAFWSPEASERFAPIDLPTLQSRAATTLVAMAQSSFIEAARARALAEAARADQSGDHATAESQWILAGGLGAAWQEGADRHFLDRYGLTRAEVHTLGLVGPISLATPIAGLTLPAPELDDDEERFEAARAGDRDSSDDHRWLAASGLDLFANLEAAPVAGHAMGHGLGLRSRVDHTHLEVRGATRMLGGSVEGGRIALVAWSGDDDNERDELFRWSIGLRYEEWHALDGAGFFGIGLPVTIALQPFDPLVLEAGVFLNGAQIKDLVDEDPTDPRHHSPLHLAATFGLRHFYVRGAVLHDIGSSDAFRGALEIGARL